MCPTGAIKSRNRSNLHDTVYNGWTFFFLYIIILMDKTKTTPTETRLTNTTQVYDPKNKSRYRLNMLLTKSLNSKYVDCNYF